MRLDITHRADLAVNAMALLAGSPHRWKASALAAELGTTIGFVPQVIGPLVKAGWVRSEPGPTGGYFAVVEPSEVSVLAVIEAVDGATESGRCAAADRPCQPDAPCILHRAWTNARRELLGVLAATSMADVVADLPK